MYSMKEIFVDSIMFCVLILCFNYCVLSSSDYERYCGEIRQEYSHIPEMEFKSKRAQVIKAFGDTYHQYMQLSSKYGHDVPPIYNNYGHAYPTEAQSVRTIFVFTLKNNQRKTEFFFFRFHFFVCLFVNKPLWYKTKNKINLKK